MAEVIYAALEGNSSEQERLRQTGRVVEAAEFREVFGAGDRVAVKVHVGERDNDTHVPPALVRVVVEEVRRSGAAPFLTETATLYRGNRSDAVSHQLQAFAHGFTLEGAGAPFVMADGLSGDAEIEVPIAGELYRSVSIAREAVMADGLVAVSHATGHIGTGLAACLKNLGMGLASRKGKLRQHSSMKPKIRASSCTLCGKCIEWCPREAIHARDGAAVIVRERCIGCGQCLAVCNFDAVKYNWAVESAELQRRIAEHALGALHAKRDRSLFINVLADMTRGCDCMGSRQSPIAGDVGILASRDPVAVDQATLDLTAERTGSDLSKESYPGMDPAVQLEHGERIGLGSRAYTLVRL